MNDLGSERQWRSGDVSGRGRHMGESVRDREREWWVVRGLKGLGGVRVRGRRGG